MVKMVRGEHASDKGNFKGNETALSAITKIHKRQTLMVGMRGITPLNPLEYVYVLFHEPILYWPPCLSFTVEGSQQEPQQCFN